jgi:hypothetical protein
MATVRKLLPLTVLLLLLPLGCGPNEVGEECDEVGDTDDCEDGAICTNVGDSNEEGICYWICEDHPQCAATQQCNGVSGTNLKSCQPQ